MFFDAHTHIQFAAYRDDREEVIKRALDAGVWMINVGTQKDTSREAVLLAREHEGVFASVGLHPIHTERSYHDAKELGDGEAAKEFVSRGEDFDCEFYKKLASDSKVVAIGECGLDYYRGKGGEESDKQKKAFVAQINLALEVKKPLMVHCRDAFTDLIDILSSFHFPLSSSPGVVHFFTGSPDDAKKLLDLGFLFTFGGVITFTRDYDEVIKVIPLDRILSETDAPYVSPVPYRGKRNEPVYVVEVVKKLAEIKGVSVDQMISHIFENAKRLFRILIS